MLRIFNRFTKDDFIKIFILQINQIICYYLYIKKKFKNTKYIYKYIDLDII